MTYRGPSSSKLIESYIIQQANKITRCVQLHHISELLEREATDFPWPCNIYIDDQIELTIQHPNPDAWTKDDTLPEEVSRLQARIEKQLLALSWAHEIVHTEHRSHIRSITYSLSHSFLRVTDGVLRIKIW